MGAEQLSAVLWQVRCHMEEALYNLETQLVHVSRGNFRWLKFTSDGLATALERLKLETLAVSMESAALTSLWGGSGDHHDLPALAALAPPGLWPEMLEDHRQALAGLAQEIRASCARNERALNGALESWTTDAGRHADLTGTGPLILRSNAQKALDILANASLRQLEEFLRLP